MKTLRPHLGILLVLVFMTLTLFGPLALLISRSMSGDVLGLLATALDRESFRLSFSQSLKIALMAGISALLLGAVGAAFRVFSKVPGSLVDLLSFLPLVLPPFAGAVGIKRFLLEYGPVNLWLLDNGHIQEPLPLLEQFGLPGVALLQALHLYPLVYFQLVGAFSDQDPSLFEAARVHGVRPLRSLLSLRLPLLIPSFISSFLFVALFSLTDLGTPLLFEVPDTLAVKIYQLAREGVGDPLGYLYSLVMLVVVVLISLGLRRASGGADRTMASDRVSEKVGGVWTLSGVVWFTCLGLLALLPHFSVLLSALATEWVATTWPEKLDFSAFSLLFKTGVSKNAIISGLWLSGLSAVFITLAGLICALNNLYEGESKFVKKATVLLDLPLVIPGILVAYGWLAAYTGTPLDAFKVPGIALICVYTVRRIPLSFRALESALATFSISSLEAGEVHGLSRMRVIMRLILPALRPYLLSAFLVGFAFTFFEVSDSLLLATTDSITPMAKALYTLANYPQDGLRLSSALGVLGMGVMTLVFLAAARLGGGFGTVFHRGEKREN